MIGLGLLTFSKSLYLNSGMGLVSSLFFTFYIIEVGQYNKQLDSIDGYSSCIYFTLITFVVALITEGIYFFVVLATAFVFVVQNYYQRSLLDFKVTLF